MSHFKFTNLAAIDLEEIYDSLAEHNAKAALKLINAFEERCIGLAEMPNQGSKRNELFPGMRSVAIGNYVIYYKLAAVGILIIRILHCKRDVQQFFSDGALPIEIAPSQDE